MPGVLAVLTGADLVAAGVKPLRVAPIFKRPDGSPGATPLRPALAHETVRFVGEAVVAVVAETAGAGARTRAEAVVVEYEELPVVTELDEATAAGRAAGLAGGDRQHRGADEARRRGGQPTPPSPPPRMSSRSTSSTSAWRRRRWSRAACWPTTTPRPTG